VRALVLLSVAWLGALALVVSAQAATGLSARVKAPPQVQRLGAVYQIRIIVRTRARPIKHLCIDFEDDKNSWSVRMPGLRAYDDDVFCFRRTFPAFVRRKTFVAKLIPAKTGAHKLQVGIGNAQIFPTINDAILGTGSLYWSDQFVII
jgi:hypothetical protein